MVKIFQDRVFNLAIFASIAWHLFWLSIITVVVTPEEARPIKFSKVSFLGPILERGALEVRIEPRERSFLEKRYRVNIAKLSDIKKSGQSSYLTRKGSNCSNEEKLTSLIAEALSGSKIEPAYSMD